jgi:hypothetical protein
MAAEMQVVDTAPGKSPDSVRPVCFPAPQRDQIPITLRLAALRVRAPSDEGLLTPSGAELVAGLSSKSLGALGRIMPMLACGEESAIHVFYREGDRLGKMHESVQKSQLLLYRIAKEEELHDILLKRVRAQLPEPDDLVVIQQKAKSFYYHIASLDPALHFFRVSELDSAVCIIMSSLLEQTCELSCSPYLQRLMERIRRDESAHVLAARRHVSELGLATATRLDDAEMTRTNLVKMLEHVADAFEELGTDPRLVYQRILHRKTLSPFVE